MEQFKTTKALILNAPVPAETRTYKPVEHQRLIDLTLNAIERSGFTLAEESYQSAAQGQIATGRYAISNVADKEMRLQIGWQNSYNKQISMKFAIGTQIMICSNGCVSGEFGAFKKKHVGEIQSFTPQAITDYIAGAGETFRKIQADAGMMKMHSITKRTQAELIGRMMIEEQFIASTQLNIIKSQIEHPTHDYGAPDSVWELYQHTTFAMKTLHPALWMENHAKAHEFFKNVESDKFVICS